MVRGSTGFFLGVAIACHLVFWWVMVTLAYAGPNAGASIALDLDVGTPGIQSNVSVVIGSNLKVEVIVGGISNLRGARNLDLLYDPAAVRVVSVNEGSFLRSGGGQTVFHSDISVPGKVNISHGILEGSCVNDTGVLAGITFKINGTQSSELSLDNVFLRDCPNKPEDEDNITSNTVGGMIEPLVFEVDVTLPAGGKNWSGGSSHEVCWTIVKGTPPYSINLKYSVDGGAYNSIAAGLSQADTGAGCHAWNPIPSINSTNVVIKAEVTDNNRATDDDVSDSFSIDSILPTVSSTTPALGGLLTRS